MEIFRETFPVLANQTIWDEITGPTIAALVILGIKWMLYREKVFHLLIVVDEPAGNTASLYVLRRQLNWDMIFLPTFQREDMIYGPQTLVRNVFWWGVFGVDRCTLDVRFGDSDATSHIVHIPRWPYRAYATIRLHMSELSDARPFLVTPEHFE